jgi:quinol monooxygenase YgiN
MYARVWHLRIRPGKIQEFKRAIDSFVPFARQRRGFLGILPLYSSGRRASETTLVALWETLDAMRTSERAGHVSRAISRFLSCCDASPRIEKYEIWARESLSTKKPSTWTGRVI